MFKQALKVLASFLLVSFILIVALGIYSVVSSSSDTESASPYLEEVMPILATWDYERISPYLSEEAADAFGSERGLKALKLFSRLGDLETFEAPQFSESKAGVLFSQGSFDLVVFTMVGHFSNGDAVFRVTLNRKDDHYSIQNINVNSDVFLNYD